jgi:hypothetical protein
LPAPAREDRRTSVETNTRAGSPGTSLLWLRGRYRSYTDYDLEVVGVLPPR